MHPTTQERTSVFFTAAALPLEEAAYLGFSWLNTYTGQVVPITARVVGREEVAVAAGSFDAWKVELVGGTPSQILWISRGDEPRIVRMEVVGEPWTYELVEIVR